jgi:hypothetical protein
VRRTLGACPAPAPPPCQAGAFFWFAVLAEMPGRGPGGAGLQASAQPAGLAQGDPHRGEGRGPRRPPGRARFVRAPVNAFRPRVPSARPCLRAADNCWYPATVARESHDESHLSSSFRGPAGFASARRITRFVLYPPVSCPCCHKAISVTHVGFISPHRGTQPRAHTGVYHNNSMLVRAVAAWRAAWRAAGQSSPTMVAT